MKKLFLIFLLISLLFLLPTFISYDLDSNYRISKIRFRPPQISAGDIPHYLVMVNSLVYDTDFELRNNYNAVLEGGSEAGKLYKGRNIVPHVRYVNPLTKDILYQAYDKGGKPLFDIKFMKDNPTYAIISTHPIGMPLFISLFFWPFMDARIIEISAVFFSIFVSLIGLGFLYKILSYYMKDKDLALNFVFFTAVGSQIWHYSGTSWTEPYIFTLFLAAYYIFSIKKMNFLPGFFLGFGLLIKYPVLLTAGVFFLYRCLTKKYRNALIFIFPICFFVGIILTYQKYFFGGFFKSPIPLILGNPARGLFGFLFSPTHSLFLFAPVLLFFILGLRRFLIIYKKDALFVSAILVINILFWSSVDYWWGGGYSARYLVPLIPFFMILTGIWFKYNTSIFLERLFYLLLGLSVIINTQAAILPFLFWDKPFWMLLQVLLTKFERVRQLFLF